MCDPEIMGDSLSLGPLLPEAWLELVVVLGLPIVLLVIAAVVTAILLHRNRRRPAPELAAAEHPAIGPRPMEAQLAEIDALLAQQQISQEEHSAMRSRILDLR